ncbi:hypothetical protein BDZ85DRAFT_280201 [Elsinoe ampelina]|uniref:Uncharacterized protein n=1 Tax=Elsinoe ampelina TaxID=302913 RepID=A0A6A6GHA5_9PEZI|nr:hypothetical protein BDZ85DRAFT_280201 [Elsinoe ampelina]
MASGALDRKAKATSVDSMAKEAASKCLHKHASPSSQAHTHPVPTPPQSVKPTPIQAGPSKVKGPSRVAGTVASSAQQVSRWQKYSEDYWIDLAKVAEPVVLYRAPSHTQLKLMGAGSLISCVCIAKFTFGPYAQFAGSNTVMLAGGGLVSAFWLAMGTYLFIAPQKMIRSISAVPEKTASMNPDTGPSLQIEFEPTLPFMPPKSIVVSALELSRDAPIEQAVHSMLKARQQEKLRFSWGKAFFIRMRSILFDFITLFTRTSFVYIKMPGRGGNGKVELPGALNYDRGKALEQVLRYDESKKTTFRKMFFTRR